MTGPEMISSLAATFKSNGVIGGRLESVFADEEDVGRQLLERFRGNDVLMHSFLDFFIETLEIVRDDIARNGWLKGAPNYPIAWVCFSNLFRRFRACELLGMKGYPLDAYSLIRDIKDRAFAIAGVAHNVAIFSQVVGAVEPPSPMDRDEYAKRSVRIRKDLDQKVSWRLIGRNSGLSLEIQKDLSLWDGFFNHEVHGAALSLTNELLSVTRGAAPSIGPTFDQGSFAMYLNRSVEIGWLLLRLLPYLQREENAFGNMWHAKKLLLDDCFRFMLETLSSLGKSIGDALIALVDKNFVFPTSFHYFEADGTA